MNLYTYDSHVHTSQTSPCGKVDAKTLVHLYSEAGYRGVVITDHYYKRFFEKLEADSWESKVNQYLKGYHTALEEGRKVGLNVLLGIEINFTENKNDYLVYGLNEDFLYKHPYLYDMGLSAFHELVGNTAICIYQAHPYRVLLCPAAPQLVGGIEVYNGNPRHNSNNPKAYEYARQNGLKMISGSDFHQVEDLARGGIILPNAPSSSEELAQMLSEDKIIKLIQSE